MSIIALGQFNYWFGLFIKGDLYREKFLRGRAIATPQIGDDAVQDTRFRHISHHVLDFDENCGTCSRAGLSNLLYGGTVSETLPLYSYG